MCMGFFLSCCCCCPIADATQCAVEHNYSPPTHPRVHRCGGASDTAALWAVRLELRACINAHVCVCVSLRSECGEAGECVRVGG